MHMISAGRRLHGTGTVQGTDSIIARRSIKDTWASARPAMPADAHMTVCALHLGRPPPQRLKSALAWVAGRRSTNAVLSDLPSEQRGAAIIFRSGRCRRCGSEGPRTEREGHEERQPRLPRKRGKSRTGRTLSRASPAEGQVMDKTAYRWNHSPDALVAAIETIARGEDPAPCACSPADALDLPWPLLLASTSVSEPLAVTALRFAAGGDRPVVAVAAELRGRMPRFEFAVGMPGKICNSYAGYEAWLPMDGHGLWLVSAFSPHPDVPLFVLSSAGLAQAESPPWPNEQDRALGLRHATVAIARLIGETA